MSDNVCPYCGCGADAYRQQIFNAAAGMHTYRFIGECVECGASGPDCDTEADAVHAFCHPRHLMEGKVMVGVEDASVIVTALDEYREMETNSGKAYPRTPDWMMSQARIKAAIDAAGGGK